MGQRVKKKSNVYCIKGGDPDKVDGGEKDEKEPKPEGEKPAKNLIQKNSH